MTDKFTMELTWHNCKTCPPKEFKNNALIATNGKEVYGLSWHKAEGYWIAIEDGCIPLSYESLDRWWWADVENTIRETKNFRQQDVDMTIEQKELLHEIASVYIKDFYNTMVDSWTEANYKFSDECARVKRKLENEYEERYGDLPYWENIDSVIVIERQLKKEIDKYYEEKDKRFSSM